MNKICAENIGKNAVTFVDQAIRNCALLASHIEKNGNTPLWDGFVLVYQASTHDKKSFFGKVPVQVKGTYSRFKSTEEVSEKAFVTDLEAYLKDGGVVYFYVYMTEEVHAIYYASLLPYDLKIILQSKLKQKEIKLTLHKFPEGNIQEMTNIFMTFLYNQRKQAGESEHEIYSLDLLEQRGIAIDNITFGFTGIGIDHSNFGKHITTHSAYFYAKLHGVEKYLTIDKTCCSEFIDEITAPIAINGEIYFNTCRDVYSKGEHSIQFGKSFRLDFNNSETGGLNTHLQGNLSERILDIKFLLSFYKHKKISVNSRAFMFSSISLPVEDEVMLEGTLARLELIKRALDALDVQEELNVDLIKEEDERNIDTLIRAIIDNDEIVLRNTDNEIVTSGFFVVANLSILVVCHKNINDGKYSINSYTKPSQIKLTYTSANQEIEVIGSQYLLLLKVHYIRASNLNYDKAYESLTSYGNNSFLVDRINNSMLEILKAYDETGKIALLGLAERLSDWILKNRGNSESQPEIDILNQLQIKRRKRDLSANEVAELLVIKRTNSDLRFVSAACILLSETEEAKSSFLKLPIETQKEFIDYPICHFWKLKEEIKNLLIKQ
ncbi:MAG: hypothetical protein VB061_02995 [Christensenella sp.]|nr:hypothetical protein [Christensenella sp.]